MSLNIATERTRQRYIHSGKLGPQATALVIDASPLWELQYTGISNVTYEITRRAVAEARAKNREVHVTEVLPETWTGAQATVRVRPVFD